MKQHHLRKMRLFWIGWQHVSQKWGDATKGCSCCFLAASFCRAWHSEQWLFLNVSSSTAHIIIKRFKKNWRNLSSAGSTGLCRSDSVEGITEWAGTFPQNIVCKHSSPFYLYMLVLCKEEAIFNQSNNEPQPVSCITYIKQHGFQSIQIQNDACDDWKGWLY